MSLHDPIGTDKEGNEITQIDILGSEADDVIKEVDLKIEKSKIYRNLNILDDREKDRFGLDTGGEERTQWEIAKELGISRSYVSRIEKNPLFIHIISANYNLNSGLDVPQAILDNQYCDFGTGLLLFYNADGYRLLDSQDVVLDSPLKGWNEFLTNLYKKLLDIDFSSQSISFTPPLTKVQIFKLKKSNPSIPNLLISKSPGKEEEIPTL